MEGAPETTGDEAKAYGRSGISQKPNSNLEYRCERVHCDADAEGYIALESATDSSLVNSGARMLYAMLILIGLQFLGDIIADCTAVPVPGMVIGLVLLFGMLCARGCIHRSENAVPEALNRVAKVLHDNLGLMFVPAGAGVIANGASLAADGARLLAAVLLSTLATIAVTGLLAGRRQVEPSVSAVSASR